VSEENPIARMQRRLRADTAKLFNYDINNLSAWQSVRLDRASTLRLQLDDISAAQLRGDPIDMPRFILASKELEAMFGGRPDETSTVPDFSGAREELRALFERRFSALERRREREEREMVMDPNKARAEAHAAFETKLQLAIEKYGAEATHAPDLKPAGGFARHDSVVPLPTLTESAAAVSGGLPAPEPAPRKSLDEINAEPPPAHFLKQDSPWRQHLDADGNIVAPYFRVGYG
jgi:hypothetical protein